MGTLVDNRFAACPHSSSIRPFAGTSRQRKDLCGAPEGIRTPNLLIRSQTLYPLSYGRSAPARWKPRRGLLEDTRPRLCASNPPGPERRPPIHVAEPSEIT